MATYGDDVGRQATVAEYLASLNADHIVPELINPNLEYHLIHDFEAAREAGYMPREGESWDAKFANRRIDGRSDNRPLSAPLQHATIGSNGREPGTNQVHVIGLDIDDGDRATGIPTETRERLITKFKMVKWLHVYTSRGGQGIHVVVRLARKVYALNNSEVYLLAAAMVQRIAEEIDEPDLADLIDKAGSVLFFTSPKVKPGGFVVLSKATELFTEDLKKVIPEPRHADPTFEVSETVELDDEHKRIFAWLSANHDKDFSFDGKLGHGHTTDFARLHAALGLKGHFATNATGNGDEKFNCFFKPLSGGRILVGHWGNGESDPWKQGRGYRYAILNSGPTLRDFAAKHAIVKDARTGLYLMDADEAEEFEQLNGRQLPSPGPPLQSVYVAERDGQLQFEIIVTPAAEIRKPWRRVNQKRASYIVATNAEGVKRRGPDTAVRVAYVPDGKGHIYFRRIHTDRWHEVGREDAATVLRAHLGMNPDEIDRYLTTERPWQLVSEPFQPEFPRPFHWNFRRIGFDHEVSPVPGPYPTWQRILDHVGRGLDDAVRDDPWCQANGLRFGADYLKLYVSRMFRAPSKRLPIISFHSAEQNCGKSTFASAHGKLMTKGGYVMADKALTTNFSNMLLGAVLCDLDDVDLSNKDSGAYTKLQPILTNDELVIEGKGTNTIQVDNTSHWVHTSNIPEACPVQNGDTRFVVVEVGELETEIAAETMVRALMAEAPFYLHELMTMKHPEEPAGRLFLPVLDTPLKTRLMATRAAKRLNGEAGTWLTKLRELADAGKLRTLTTFAELQPLMGAAAPGSAEAFRPAWLNIATILEADGYTVESRKNNGGKSPAAWSIRKNSSRGD